jgi:hypothetical protein
VTAEGQSSPLDQRLVVSSTSARHRKPSRRVSGRRPLPSQASKPPAARLKPAPVVAIASAAVFIGAAAAAVVFASQAHPPGPGQRAFGGTAGTGGQEAATARLLPGDELAAALVQAGGKLRTLTPTPMPEPKPAPGKSIKAIKSIKPAAKPLLTPRPKPAKPAPPPPPVYLNPLRAISGLLGERIDMGADFGGTGPIYAIGNAVVTSETTSAGWPGGGWITYQLTNGPAAGLQVFVAEDVTPTVQVGEHVTSSTVIAQMYNGGAGIETGWALPDGSSAESQSAAAGGVSGGGPFPTAVGVNFDNLLLTLGAPPANNAGQAAFGVLPPNYPTNWSAATAPS